MKRDNKIEDINIKKHTYYFFDDNTSIIDFDPNNIILDEKSYKTILTYFNAYATSKDSKYVKINSVNAL